MLETLVDEDWYVEREKNFANSFFKKEEIQAAASFAAYSFYCALLAAILQFSLSRTGRYPFLLLVSNALGCS